MKPIKNSFSEKAYEFVTESGLHVTLVYRPGFKRSIAAYGTPFGALDLKQTLDGYDVVHKTGVAHFLEHKLFEDESNDVFSQFAQVGASANAFTSYDHTVYYFSTNGDVLTPLGILIDFVSRFNLNQERVDKEKGIILEELRMYAKMPDMNLLMRTYANVYHTFPLRIDIGGTEEDVSSMLLDDLMTAYRMNYTDSRMGLVVVTGAPLDEVVHIIHEHTKDHSDQHVNVKTYFDPEPLTVRKAYEVITDHVLTPKMSLSYKFKYTGQNTLFDEYQIRLILELNFSELDDSYQSWIDQEIISESFGYDVDLRDGFGTVYFFNDGIKPDEFKTLIDAKMKALSINEEDFNQLSKRRYGQLIMSMERYDRFALNILNTSFKNVGYFEYLEFIRTLSFSSVTHILSILHDFSVSFVLMNPENKYE